MVSGEEDGRIRMQLGRTHCVAQPAIRTEKDTEGGEALGDLSATHPVNPRGARSPSPGAIALHRRLAGDAAAACQALSE
eukprot:1336096-Prymnesium_polylepis.1